MRHPWLRFLVAGLLVLAAVPQATAQRTSATLRGTVTDPTGAVVKGAQVTVRNEETGFSRSMKTNDSGIYSFTDLPIGSYQVSAEQAGFKVAVTKGVTLNVADDRAADIKLEAGDVKEQITVEASALGVQTIGGDVSGLVTGEQVRELPLNGRNFLQLALLMPGVTAPDFLNVKDKGLLGGSDIAVSGSAVTSNVWTVDGANNNDVGSNRTILIYPSVDAIEEFKIHRNSYGAEFGQAGGAQINVVTRGGTNDFHGTLFYFGRNDALNSKNYFLKKVNGEKEALKRHDFGFSFGGPIVKDKVHFFVSQEWNRETRGTVRSQNVPTLLERAGNFSGPTCGTDPKPIDPLTGVAFPGNTIPADRLSPGGVSYLKLFPDPNTSGCPNWVDSVDTPINWRQENARLDWTISDRTRVMVRFTQDSWVNGAPSLQANLWGDDPFPAVDSKWNQPSRSLVLQLNQNIGSAAVNSLTFSYSANAIEVTRGEDGEALNREITTNIPAIFSNKRYGADQPHPVFWGGGGYAALWNEAPFENNQDLFVLKDDYTQVFGKHFVKIGVLASMNKKNEDAQGGGPAEVPQFWGAAGLNGWGTQTGNTLGNFLLRDMTFGFSEVDREPRALIRWSDLEFYVSDSWKASSNLTLDLGVRASYFRHPYQDDGLASSFNPETFDPALGGSPCNGLLFVPGTNPCEGKFPGGRAAPDKSLMEKAKLRFAPRLGAAWDISGTGKTAIRAGLGLFYLRERVSPSLGLTANPPFAVSVGDIRKLDVAPAASSLPASFGRPTSGRALDTKIPSNWQWNLSVEHELFSNTILEVGYVGNKGQDLLRSMDINQVAPANRLAFAQATGNDGARAALRPFTVWGNNRITFWDHSADSSYHSLQTQLTRRFGRGSQLQASYTFSRTIATDPLDNSNGGIDPDVAITALENPELDRGLSKTHRAHAFNASLLLNLPTFEGKSGFVKSVLGDWQIGTIVQAMSGSPITVYTRSVPVVGGASIDGISGTGYTDNQRPNRTGEPCAPSGGPKEQIINPGAFTLNGFQLGSIGSSSRGVCEGPGLFQTDLSLYKNIRISDKLKAQFRLDIFNLFDTVNFIGNGNDAVKVDNIYNPLATLNTTVIDPATGVITPNVATATTITSAALAANSTFGQARAARDPRQMQFALRLIF